MINLSNNKITDESCKELSNVIYKNNSLCELYLHWNAISKKGS